MFGNGHIESGDKSFYRIGEVSRLTDTKPFVLRYWETEFPMLQPVKSNKGHRLYRREDVETVLRIKRLLYDEGFTIAGARRHLREEGGSQASSAEDWPATEESRVAERIADTPAGELTAEGESQAEDRLPSNGEDTTAEGGLAADYQSMGEDRPAPEYRPPVERRAEAPAMISRKVLLDLRESLRAFLTLLENE